ncbi:MAG: TonB-dependent receptor [Prevotellaceae bacterium]|nr:TonB-dependent receptor [Prevotellaceae bacterium]
MKQILSEIERTSQYSFFYSTELSDLHTVKSLKVVDQTIEKTLNELFANTQIAYRTQNYNIILLFSRKISETGQPVGKFISGFVKDSKGEPVAGASVSVKGTTNGTMSDNDGRFELQAPENSTVTVSYIGFIPQVFKINEQSYYNISLEENEELLDEVVVVGYGTQRKSDLTGSVALIDTETLNSTPSNDFGSALKGRAAGVQVITPSGKPNAGFAVRVRGASSINAGNEPLYIVDGIPTTDTKSINPNDIETISILKDAASAAIYGAAGANGVVLITTKKGDKGHSKVQLNSYWGLSQNIKTMQVLNAEQYASLMSDLGYSLDTERYNAATDWQKEIYRRAPVQNYQLSFSGGTDKTAYYTSLGYVNQKGIVKSSEFERYNFKINVDSEIKTWLKAGSTLHFSRIEDVDVGDGNSESAILSALNTPPVIGIYNEDGTFTGNPFQTGWENPLSYTDGNERKWVSTRLLANIFTEIYFTKNIKLKNSIALEHSNDKYDSFIDPFRTNWGRANRGIAAQNKGTYNKWTNENILSFNSKIAENHSLEALAGFIVSADLYEYSAISFKGFANDRIPSFDAGTVLENKSETITENANVSALGRVNYALQNKYLATANFRADGSSKFGYRHRWGYFPSFSAGWRLSEESFLKNVNILNDLKIRAGWGITGNDQIGSYNAFAVYGTGANYPFNDIINSGYYQQNIGNEKLKWETTNQTNLGLDLSIFNSRIVFTADIYYKKTADLLLYVQLPQTTGFSSGLQNIGNVENKGFEFLLSTKNLTGNFQWNSDLNFSLNRNKVISLGDTPMIFAGTLDDKIKGDVSVVMEGEPLGSFYGYKAVGVNPENGDLMYENAHGMLVYGNELNPDTDRRIIGCAQPDFIYGINNTLIYKGIELSVFLQGAYGAQVYNASRMFMEGMFDSRNQSVTALDRWIQTGQYTTIPRARQANYENSQISTRFVEDGSYLRIKNIRLAYTLPLFTKKAMIERCTIYATADNLITFTKYSGYDPELSKDGASSTSLGIDQGTYPFARTFVFGINLTF